MTPDTIAILGMGAISNILLAIAVRALAKVATELSHQTTELSNQNKSIATIAANTARTDMKVDSLSSQLALATTSGRAKRGGD